LIVVISEIADVKLLRQDMLEDIATIKRISRIPNSDHVDIKTIILSGL
jgi:hypothetical protein